MRAGLVLKTLLFTLVMPGTVVGWLPWMLAFDGPRFRWIMEGERHLLGVIPMAIGLMLYLWCAADFIRRGLGTPAPIDPPKHLVVQGLYRVTRNPMYVAMITILAGEVVVSGSVSLAQYAAVVLAAFHAFVVFYEEPMLRALFGDEYLAYARRVPRWLWPVRTSS